MLATLKALASPVAGVLTMLALAVMSPLGIATRIGAASNVPEAMLFGVIQGMLAGVVGAVVVQFGSIVVRSVGGLLLVATGLGWLAAGIFASGLTPEEVGTWDWWTLTLLLPLGDVGVTWVGLALLRWSGTRRSRDG